MTEQDALDIAVRAVSIYAGRHPRPSQVTAKQAADMLGLSRPTVRKFMDAGRLKYNHCGLIPIEQVDALLASCT
jgi:excisionase family DNA binding protein